MSITSYWRLQLSTKKHSNLASGISRVTSLSDVKNLPLTRQLCCRVRGGGSIVSPILNLKFESFRVPKVPDSF